MAIVVTVTTPCYKKYRPTLNVILYMLQSNTLRFESDCIFVFNAWTLETDVIDVFIGLSQLNCRIFRVPGRILIQTVEMPDHRRYLTVNRTVDRPSIRYSTEDKRLAVCLGCPVEYAPDLVYGKATDPNMVQLVTYPVSIFQAHFSNHQVLTCIHKNKHNSLVQIPNKK